MESLAEIIKKYFTPDMIRWYRPEAYDNCISINEPSYVNIDRDSAFKVTKSGCTIKIENSKCAVNLWIDVQLLHVTIF